MIDYKQELTKELQSIGLPVYYELFVDSKTQTPCITYMEVNNLATLEGVMDKNYLLYSRLTFNVKLWGDSLAQLAPYLNPIDSKMRNLGFERINYNELAFGSQLELILTYQAIGWEKND